MWRWQIPVRFPATPSVLTLLSVTVVQAVGVSVQRDPASARCWDLMEPQDGDVLHDCRFLLQDLQACNPSTANTGTVRTECPAAA